MKYAVYPISYKSAETVMMLHDLYHALYHGSRFNVEYRQEYLAALATATKLEEAGLLSSKGQQIERLMAFVNGRQGTGIPNAAGWGNCCRVSIQVGAWSESDEGADWIGGQQKIISTLTNLKACHLLLSRVISFAVKDGAWTPWVRDSINRWLAAFDLGSLGNSELVLTHETLKSDVEAMLPKITNALKHARKDDVPPLGTEFREKLQKWRQFFFLCWLGTKQLPFVHKKGAEKIEDEDRASEFLQGRWNAWVITQDAVKYHTVAGGQYPVLLAYAPPYPGSATSLDAMMLYAVPSLMVSLLCGTSGAGGIVWNVNSRKKLGAALANSTPLAELSAWHNKIHGNEVNFQYPAYAGLPGGQWCGDSPCAAVPHSLGTESHAVLVARHMYNAELSQTVPYYLAYAPELAAECGYAGKTIKIPVQIPSKDGVKTRYVAVTARKCSELAKAHGCWLLEISSDSVVAKLPEAAKSSVDQVRSLLMKGVETASSVVDDLRLLLKTTGLSDEESRTVADDLDTLRAGLTPATTDVDTETVIDLPLGLTAATEVYFILAKAPKSSDDRYSNWESTIWKPFAKEAFGSESDISVKDAIAGFVEITAGVIEEGA